MVEVSTITDFNIIVSLLALTAILFAVTSVLAILLYRRVKDLSQSRENLQLTLEATTDLVVLLDRNACYVDIFSSDKSLLFVSREQVIGRPVSEILGSDLGHQTQEILASVFLTGKHGFLSYSLSVTEKVQWYEASFFKRDESVVVVTIRNVTKLRAIESDASRLRDRLRFTLSSAGIGVWEWDLESGRGIWDESMYRLYGSNPGDLTLDFNEWREMIVAADRERAVAETLMGLEIDGRIDTQFRVFTKRGVIEHLRSVGELVRDTSGKPVRILGVTWSISKEASLAEEFERQKLFTSNIMDSLGDPVFLKDANHRWTYGNRAFSRMLGVPAEAYIGMTDHDLFPKDVADKFWESDNFTLSSMQDFEVEERIVLPDGGERTILTKKTPLLMADGSVTLIGVLRDITERRQMERQLDEQRTRQVAASRLASLGEMAGGMAHEINNPLAIISGYASRVRDLIDGLQVSNSNDDHKAKNRAIEIASRIEATTLRIATIVKGLKSIARDGSQDEKELVDAISVIDETLGLCVENFKNEGVTMETDLKANLPIMCRRVQISQVLLNLLTNAFFAVGLQDGGKKIIRITASRAGEVVQIAIEDSGPGVPQHAKEKIFEPFYTTKPVGKGTGLGLSIAASLVRDHGGTIFLDEESPRTRFVLNLPVART